MAKRCKHLNCTVTEEVATKWDRDVVDGVPDEQAWSGEAYPTGLVEVRCPDCGMQKSFKSRYPAWLENYIHGA